jgi:hypothetical protein
VIAACAWLLVFWQRRVNWWRLLVRWRAIQGVRLRLLVRRQLVWIVLGLRLLGLRPIVKLASLGSRFVVSVALSFRFAERCATVILILFKREIVPLAGLDHRHVDPI